MEEAWALSARGRPILSVRVGGQPVLKDGRVGAAWTGYFIREDGEHSRQKNKQHVQTLRRAGAGVKRNEKRSASEAEGKGCCEEVLFAIERLIHSGSKDEETGSSHRACGSCKIGSGTE